MPGLKHTLKAPLGYSSKITHNPFEINGSLHSGIFGEFACDNFVHMKVAHLHRYVFKEFHNAGLSIKDNRLKNKAFFLELFQKIAIHLFGFRGDEIVGDWLFILHIFGYKQSKFVSPPSKPGGINDSGNLSGRSRRNPWRITVNALLYPCTGPVIFYGEFLEGITMIDIVLKQDMIQTNRTPLRRESFPASEALISLNPSESPVLFYPPTFTKRAVFLQDICK